jgi:hypothetical protein
MLSNNEPQPQTSLDDENMAIGLFIAKMGGKDRNGKGKKGEIVLGTKTTKQK